MAIPVERLHYGFRVGLNRRNSDFSQHIKTAEVDYYLNTAYEIWFENRVSLFEQNSKARNDLRQFEEKKVVLNCSPRDEKCCFAQYPENLYKLTRQTAKVDKDPCGEKEIVIRIIQTDDISEAFRNPYRKPSYEYEETFAEEAGDGIMVYKGDFEINSICIDYLRKLTPVAGPSLTKSGSYRNADNQVVSSDVDFEIDSTYVWKDIVDIAVLTALRDISEVQDFQTQLNKILTLDKMFKT